MSKCDRARGEDLQDHEHALDTAETLSFLGVVCVDAPNEPESDHKSEQTETCRGHHGLGQVEVEIQVLESLEERDQTNNEEDEEERERPQFFNLLEWVIGVEDDRARQVENHECHYAGKQRRSHPARNDLTHLRPVDCFGADRHRTEADDGAHDRMCCRNR